jgi:hypothetical protein
MNVHREIWADNNRKKKRAHYFVVRGPGIELSIRVSPPVFAKIGKPRPVVRFPVFAQVWLRSDVTKAQSSCPRCYSLAPFEMAVYAARRMKENIHADRP